MTMNVKQKLPWVKPTLRKLEVTQDLIDLFPCNGTVRGGISTTGDEEAFAVAGNLFLSS